MNPEDTLKQCGERDFPTAGHHYVVRVDGIPNGQPPRLGSGTSTESIGMQLLVSPAAFSATLYLLPTQDLRRATVQGSARLAAAAAWTSTAAALMELTATATTASRRCRRRRRRRSGGWWRRRRACRGSCG